MMRNARVLACVPFLLAGCGESIPSSPTAASPDAAPRPATPLVVESDTTRISGLSPEQWQTLYDEFHKALNPWAAPPGLGVPGPNYDAWDRRQLDLGPDFREPSPR